MPNLDMKTTLGSIETPDLIDAADFLSQAIDAPQTPPYTPRGLSEVWMAIANELEERGNVISDTIRVPENL